MFMHVHGVSDLKLVELAEGKAMLDCMKLCHFLGDKECCYALARQMANSIMSSYPEKDGPVPVKSNEPLHKVHVVTVLYMLFTCWMYH